MSPDPLPRVYRKASAGIVSLISCPFAVGCGVICMSRAVGVMRRMKVSLLNPDAAPRRVFRRFHLRGILPVWVGC